jgi:hypothetical protein
MATETGTNTYAYLGTRRFKPDSAIVRKSIALALHSAADRAVLNWRFRARRSFGRWALICA